MVNRYEIKCHYCGEMVPAGKGECWSVTLKRKDRFGRERKRKAWRGCHLDCQRSKIGRVGGRHKPVTATTRSEAGMPPDQLASIRAQQESLAALVTLRAEQPQVDPPAHMRTAEPPLRRVPTIVGLPIVPQVRRSRRTKFGFEAQAAQGGAK
jgi:hypothetical protein